MGDHDASDEHSHSPRTVTDEYLWTMDVNWLMDFAGECPVEPADEKVCDACAAYLIGQQKEQAQKANHQGERVIPPFQASLLLQAMSGKLETEAKALLTGPHQKLDLGYLKADIALVAQLLAEHIHRTEVDIEE